MNHFKIASRGNHSLNSNASNGKPQETLGYFPEFPKPRAIVRAKRSANVRFRAVKVFLLVLN